MEALGALLVLLLTAIPITIVVGIFFALYYGWALSILWGWFMVPILHLPYITIWQAAGLLMVWNLFARDYSIRDGEQPINPFIIIGPLMSLLLGWVIRAFFM